MRYTITRYFKYPGDGYIDPLSKVYTSLEAAVKDLPSTFITGQANSIQLIPTTDDSLSVYVGNRSSDDFVVLTREDNPFFGCSSIVYGISQIKDKNDINDVHGNIYDALFRIVGNYLKSITTQPELF